MFSFWQISSSIGIFFLLFLQGICSSSHSLTHLIGMHFSNFYAAAVTHVGLVNRRHTPRCAVPTSIKHAHHLLYYRAVIYQVSPSSKILIYWWRSNPLLGRRVLLCFCSLLTDNIDIESNWTLWLMMHFLPSLAHHHVKTLQFQSRLSHMCVVVYHSSWSSEINLICRGRAL